MRRGEGSHGPGVWTAHRPRTRIAVLAAIGLAGLAGGVPARASLGHAADSVELDRAHMAARMTSTQASTHTVQVLSLPHGGGVVREFMSPGGVVFAVAWRGPGRPDLRQLLGEHFDTLQAESVIRAGRRLSAPLAASRSDFVVHSGGHPGAFWGVAYLPQKLPAGVSVQDLQTR